MALTGYSIPDTLTDDAGNTLFAVTVDVTGPNNYTGTITSSATTGIFRLGPLPVGDYTLSRGARSVTVPVVAADADVVAEAAIVVNVRAFGAKGDGVTNDTTAIQAAIDGLPGPQGDGYSGQGGTVFLPAGRYVTSSPLIIRSGLNLAGAGRDASFITNTTSDMFTWTGNAEDWNITSLGVKATAGHVIAPAVGGNCSRASLRDLRLVQNSAAHSIWRHRGIYLDMLVEHCDFYISPTATVPGWDFIDGQGGLNSNTWRRLRVNGSGADVPFFRIEETSVSSYTSDNVFQDITGEICDGGLIHAYGAQGYRIENVCNYDTATHTGSLFKFVQSAGAQAPRALFIANSGRRGGALAAGQYDVDALSLLGGTLINVGPISGNPVFNLPTKGLCILQGGGEGAMEIRGEVLFTGVVGGPIVIVAPTFGSAEGLLVQPNVSGYTANMYGARGFGNAVNRWEVTSTGSLRWGDGTNPVDVELKRFSPNLIGLAAGDTFYVDGTWNGGMIRLGTNFLWVDAAGKLRMSAGAPASDLAGVIVGTQA